MASNLVDICQVNFNKMGTYLVVKWHWFWQVFERNRLEFGRRMTSVLVEILCHEQNSLKKKKHIKILLKLQIPDLYLSTYLLDHFVAGIINTDCLFPGLNNWFGPSLSSIHGRIHGSGVAWIHEQIHYKEWHWLGATSVFDSRTNSDKSGIINLYFTRKKRHNTFVFNFLQ